MLDKWLLKRREVKAWKKELSELQQKARDSKFCGNCHKKMFHEIFFTGYYRDGFGVCSGCNSILGHESDVNNWQKGQLSNIEESDFASRIEDRLKDLSLTHPEIVRDLVPVAQRLIEGLP